MKRILFVDDEPNVLAGLERTLRVCRNEWELHFYELALKLSGAVQAARWTRLGPELGYVYSFNGPHSLFSDTIRSMRALVVSHQFGHVLMGEQDEPINLLHRALHHHLDLALDLRELLLEELLDARHDPLDGIA